MGRRLALHNVLTVSAHEWQAPCGTTCHHRPFLVPWQGQDFPKREVSSPIFMKFRSLAVPLLFSSGLFTLPLSAQDQGATNAPAPLQLQENPVPGASAAPADTNPPAAPAAAPSPTPDTVAAPAATNLPAPGDPSAPAADSGMGSPGQNPPPSDPNSLIPPPVAPEQPSPINASGNEEKQRQEQKTRYYSVKVKADKDDDLVELQDKADKAKNDEAKRQALRQYYDLLAKRMKKIDPSLSEWIDTMHSAYLRRLEQVRVEPTIPINPPPVPGASPEASPSPSATPHHKKKKTAPANEN
jgi:hypothetical protein